MSTYRALSIVAPSGTKIARGEKTLEVWRWTPDELPIKNLLIIENGHYLTEAGQILSTPVWLVPPVSETERAKPPYHEHLSRRAWLAVKPTWRVGWL